MEDSTKGVPFVVTFHPKLTLLVKRIKDLSKYLHIDKEVKAVFTPTPVASFHSARKIKDYLVRAKLFPLEWNVDVKCVIILKVQISFLAKFLVSETNKINHYFDWDSK